MYSTSRQVSGRSLYDEQRGERGDNDSGLSDGEASDAAGSSAGTLHCGRDDLLAVSSGSVETGWSDDRPVGTEEPDRADEPADK
jgi:hypothetical protein